MKNSILLSIALMFTIVISKAQSNYLDTYISNPVTLTTIGTTTNQLNQPRDLDFKPNSNELWVCNYGTSNGGSTVIFYNAGLPNQTSQYRKDTHSSHFMIYPSAIAFGDNGQWACVSEIQNTNPSSATFMGPALWLADTSIFARVFQNNWVNGLPLGSHIDMLHQSPFAMGIAHDSAMAYWVMDGYNGNICKYDFVQDHGPGYDNHSAGKIWRYIDVPVSRVPQIPSHMILDKVNKWLYFIDGGAKKIKRMNTNSGAITGTLTVPPSANEPLGGYWKVEGAAVETIDSLSTQPCGIDFYNGRLIVSDYTTGDIYLYDASGAVVTLLDTIVTGHAGMMGIKVGPDGHIWCVNKTENKIYRLDVAAPATDVSIVNITSPSVENFVQSFYSTAFNVCDGNINPSITILNNGTNSVNTVDFEYTLDNGSSPVSYSWSGSLPSGNSTSVAMPSAAVSNGSHLLKVNIISVNGASDDVDLNNVFTGSFRSINPPVTLPLNETFTTNIFPPVGWNYVNFNKNCKMSRVTTGGFGVNTGGMKMDNYSGVMDITGQKDYLMSPVIDMTSATTNTFLRFNVAYAKYNASSNDAMQILASTDCGNTWTSVYNKSGTALATTTTLVTSAFTPNATQWRTDSVSMSAFSGQSNVILSFNSISNYGNNFYVDDIFVGDVVTGISDISPENIISIFPNPASDVINIELSLTEPAVLSLNDLLGKEILVQNISSYQKNIQFNTFDIRNGIYLVSITTNSYKFVKQVIINK